ncbi:MAG: DUF192 domain-containing protein [Ignavibacteria bacterium]|nr:DUF192 domain-containing protein [Ignavibacteria bacterium]
MKQKRHQRPESGKPRNTNKTSPWIGGAVILLAAIVVAVFVIPSSNQPIQQRPSPNPVRTEFEFRREGEVTFISASNTFITTIDVEIADNVDRRTLGLMYRERLEPNQGMFFIFRSDEMLSFWMKNTKIPLDMIFANSRNQIVTIHKNTIPGSEQGYESTEPGKYVIEVNAGFTSKHGIRVGDKIEWRRL